MLSLKQKLIRLAAATTAVGAVAAAGLTGGSASADPIQYIDPLYGYGSDTTQDVMNALAGYSNGVSFTPLVTAGLSVLASWDAFPANSCISPVVGAPEVLRPNGSTNGQRILSAANNAGARWPLSATSLCGGQKSVSGMVDFARSSSGPSGSGNALVFMPFGRDSLSFAYTRPTGSPVTNIALADMTLLHTTGPQLIGGVPVIACGIQTGSGTYDSWMDRVVAAGSGDRDSTGTALCNGVGGVPDTGGRLQENNGPELTAKANLLSSMTHPICDGVAGGAAVACTNAQLVVGFSASQYIARSNNVGAPNPGLEGTGFSGMGGIAGLPSPVNCTTPTNCAPVAAAYNSATFGRDVYNVALRTAVTGFFADARLTEMFVGSTSLVCSSGTTIEQHGYLTLGSNCGSTTLQGPFVLS
jgi:ABC-type phosphate transport system substrate-binding protein